MKRLLSNSVFILGLSLGLISSMRAEAGVEPVLRNTLTGDSIRVDSFRIVEDVVYTNNDLGDYNLYKALNYVTVEINQDQIASCYLDSFCFTANVEITGWDESGTPTVDTGYFTVCYDQRTGKQYKGIQTKKLEGFYKVKIKVLSVSNNALTDYISISAEIAIERYKDLDLNTAATLASTSYSSATGDITVNWDAMEGAEEYDLEYTFVDNYNGVTLGGTLGVSDLKVDFTNNASRVTVVGTSYSFSNVFEQGYVVFRVRAASYTGDDFTWRVTGKWSDDGYDPDLDEYSTDERILVSALEPTFNWQYVNTFSEEGKRKELISFMDGTFRNRQSVTSISSDETIVVGETVYDHQGRPALQVLPVPYGDTGIRYYPNFNVDSLTKTNYSRIHFDTGTCEVLSNRMTIKSGAAQYYSLQNPYLQETTHWLSDHNPYIPDAKGMPFVRTVYTDDNSGRVALQSGVGQEHAIGSTHETRYFYGTPYQEEIDRLFGNNVGFAKHYQKQMVVDPNGQVSVSYTDLSGKVIATSLAGEEPANVTKLSNNDGLRELEVQLIPYDDYSMPDPYTTQISKKINVAVPSEYRLNYLVGLGGFEQGCMEVCYECVYDLTISVKDDCGEELLDGDANTGGIQPFVRQIKRIDSSYFSISCADDTVYKSTLDELLSDSMRVTLGVGSYFISKQLTVSEKAAQYYAGLYLQDTACVLEEQDFIDYHVAAIDDFGCETTCEECTEMLSDSAGYVAARNAHYVSQGYINEGEDDLILEMAVEEYVRKKAICQGICNQSISPCEYMHLVMTVDVSAGGQYEALQGVVTDHPEYCRYEFCVNHPQFARYELMIDSISDGNWAIDNGFMDPLKTHADFPNGSYDTFFYNNPEFKSILIEELDEVLSVPDTNDVYHDLDVWESAIWVSYFILGRDTTPYYSPYAEAVATNKAYEVMGDRCYLKDPYMWEIFRALYKVARSRAYERILADSACVGMSIPTGKQARFIPLDDVDQVTGADESELETYTYAHCEAGCDSMSGAWMALLGDCVTEHEDAEEIRQALVAACAAGCGPNYPMGSTAGFKAVLESYGIYEAGICDPAILSVPSHSIAGANQELQVDTTEHDCLCHQEEEQCVPLDTDPAYLSVLRTLYYAPREQSCDTLCIECEQLRDTLLVFLELVGDSMELTDSSQALVWQKKLTVYFNAKFGTKNTFDGYLAFMEACLQENPDSLAPDTVVNRFIEYTDPVNPDYSDGEDVEAYLDSVYDQLDVVEAPFDPLPDYHYGQGALLASLDVPNTNDLYWPGGQTLTLPYTFAPMVTENTGTLISPCICKTMIQMVNSDTNKKNPANSHWEDSCGAAMMTRIFKACYSALNNQAGRDVMTMHHGTPWTPQDSLDLYQIGKGMNLFIPSSCVHRFDCPPTAVDTAGPSFGEPGDTSGYYQGVVGPYPNPDTVKALPCDSLLARLLEFIQNNPEAYIPLTDSMKQKAAGYIDSVFSGTPYYRDAGNLTPKQKAARLQAQFEKCLPKDFGPGDPCHAATIEALLSRAMYCTDCVIENRFPPLIKRWLRQETRLVQVTEYDKVNFLVINNHEYAANGMTAFYDTDLYTGGDEAFLTMSYQQPMSRTGASPKLYTITDGTDTVRLHLAFISANETINFISNIRGIKSVRPVQSGCTSTFAFRLEVIIEDFEEQIHIVDMYGETDAYELYEACVPDPPTMCSGWGQNAIPIVGIPAKCNFDLSILAEAFAKRSYEAYMDSVKRSFIHNYKTHCIGQAIETESLAMRFDQQEYHYTLYYYDLAGNLIQTVPPEGVNFLNLSEVNQTNDFREGSGSAVFASHDLVTTYQYNTLNELKFQNTPDGGTSDFWYDWLGRLVVSRNAKQKAYTNPTYSYTEYDALGRIREVGEVEKGADDTMSFALAFGDMLGDWLIEGDKTQITKTFYDEKAFTFTYNGFTQNFLRNRVSSTTYTAIENGPYQSAVHYDYDVHGNVGAMVREYPPLDSIYEQYKVIRYEYELVSGNVLKVLYQQDSLDRFFHKYEYDSDNRVVGAYTSTDQVHWDRDAAYTYYLHGPMARTELGELRVQGMDYAYTLHGWLKGVNSERLRTSHDIGKDGNNGSNNQWVCPDVFGYGLGYYAGDYKSIGTISTATNFIIDKTSSDLLGQGESLFNGNISSMVTAIGKFMEQGDIPFGRAFQYDQLNRIKSSRAYNNVDTTNNVWKFGGSALTQYATDYTYDANGNILTLLRKGKASQTNMDNLTYHYYSGTNRLNYVDDAVSAGNYGIDIDDQWTGNYEYDAIGNLIADSAEQIEEITWTVYGKIQSINRVSGSSKPDLQFEYSPDGYRIAKHVIDATTGFTTSTWYVRDATGNIMATYEKTEYTVLDTSAITLSLLNNLVVTDWGAHVFSRFMEEAVEIHELMDAGQFTSLKSDLTTATELEDALRMLSPMLILPLESTLMDDVLFDYSYSDFYTAMLAYYGSTTAYGNALQSGCKSALITHLVGTYYFSSNFARTLFTNHPTLGAAVWSHFQPGAYPGAAGAVAFLHATVSPVTNLYNDIGTTFNTPTVNIVAEFSTVFGTSVLGTAISSFMNLKPCTRTVQGDLTMFGILDLYDRTELWDQMIANSSVSSLADMMIDHAPGKFVQAAIELNPTRANTLFSGLDPMNTYHVTDYLNAILNYPAFGSSYYQDIVNQLMTLGYVTDGWNYSVSEHHIYGSSRVGVHKTEKELRTRFDQGNILVTLDDVEYTTLYRGKRHYELSNHLGNVQVVVSDKRISVCDGMDVESFKADVLAAMDYYPFGMMIPDRQWYAGSDSSNYRFGFNGQEKDNEVSGQGNSTTAEYWQYDARLGRRWNVDPVIKEWESSYACFSNNPIQVIDPSGADGYIDPDGNYLGDDGDESSHTTRVITTEMWENFKKNPEYFKDGKFTDEGRKVLQKDDKSNSVPLEEYQTGINIKDETWSTLVEKGGTKLVPFVTNNNKCTIFYKPEGNNENFGKLYKNDGAYPIGEGQSLYIDVDGVTTSKNALGAVEFCNVKIYKKGNKERIIVNSDGSISVREGTAKFQSGWKGWNWLNDLHSNGDPWNLFDWKDDHSFDALFKAAWLSQFQPRK